MGAVAGAAAGVAAGAAGAAAPSFWARHCLRNSGHVAPFVVLFALAAFHSSPHCFMMLSACAPVEARPRATANKSAESAALKDVPIIVSTSDRGVPAIPRSPRPGESPTPLPLMPLFH